MARIRDFWANSLVVQIASSLVLLALVMFGTIFSLFYQTSQQTGDSTVINLAGGQRQLTQKMASLAQLAAQGDWLAARDLKVSVDRFDLVLAGLEKGDETLNLQGIPERFNKELDAVKQAWQPRRQEALDVIKGTEAAVSIQRLSSTLNPRAQAIATLCEELGNEPEIQSSSSKTRADIAKLSKLVVLIGQDATSVASGDFLPQNAVLTNANALELILKSLREGDSATGVKKVEGQAAIKVQQIDRAWKPFLTDVQNLNKMAGNYQALLQASRSLAMNTDQFIAKQDVLVSSFEAYSREKVTQLQILLIVGGAIFLLVFGLTLFFTRRALRPLKQVENAAEQIANHDLAALKSAVQKLSEGDLTSQIVVEKRSLKVNGQDEIARITAAINLILSSTYETSQALKISLDSLNQILKTVRQNADHVNEASDALKAASEETRRVTSQIVRSIQEVAKSTNKQAESTTNTTRLIDQVSNAIQGVAQGAQEQAGAVADTSSLMGNMSHAVENIRKAAQEQASQMQQAGQADVEMGGAIQAVNQASEQVAAVTNQAALSASDGREVAGKTAKGMEKVREATQTLGERVRDLGKHSSQIGTIIEAIDDIAAQTNLLALNAAIEAARAGEHGRGFAVVADEVRKLAERASSATHETAGMIRAIQSGASEAVDAMRLAGEDVQAAVELTYQAREAFEGIVEGTRHSAERVEVIRREISAMQKAAQKVQFAVKQAAEVAQRNQEAANEIALFSDKVSSSLDSVSAVVEENTAATEEMAASADEVTRSVEDIAAISEENSAAIQEVSASTEEMNAQAEDLAQSASALQKMAADLQSLVVRFKFLNE
jgi:methyl-accepting chemotaxis protein